MLSKIPIKKEYMFLAAVIILLLICYQLAFKKTIEAWKINHRLKEQSAQNYDLSLQPGYLERQNSNLSKIIGRYKTDSTTFRSRIISTISTIAEKENVKLTEVPVSEPIYHTQQLIVEKLSFTGDFFSLTKLLRDLQAAENIGMVRAATYQLTGLNTNQPKKLVLEVYLDIIK